MLIAAQASLLKRSSWGALTVTMENSNDFLVSIVGAFTVCYGLFCYFTSRIAVGLKGPGKVFLVGRNARIISAGYIIAGVIIGISSLLSWLNLVPIPRLVLLAVCAVGGLILFASWLIGTVAKYSERQ